MRTLLLVASVAVLLPGAVRAQSQPYDDWYQRNQQQSHRAQQQFEDIRRWHDAQQQQYNQRLQQEQMQELLDGMHRLEREE